MPRMGSHHDQPVQSRTCCCYTTGQEREKESEPLSSKATFPRRARYGACGHRRRTGESCRRNVSVATREERVPRLELHQVHPGLPVVLLLHYGGMEIGSSAWIRTKAT